MTRLPVRQILVVGVLAVFGCGGVSSAPDGGGGMGGGSGGTTGAAGRGGMGGAAGAAGTGVGGSGGADGGGGATGGGSGATGGSSGGMGGTGTAGAGGATAGAGGAAGNGGTTGAAGTGGATGGTGGTGEATGGAGGATGGVAGAGGNGGDGRGGTGGGSAGTGGGAGTTGTAGTGGATAIPVVTGTNFAVVAHGLDLTIYGSGFSAATSLTIGGVAHTPAIVSNTQIRTQVLDTTPTGAQSIVLANAGGSSLPFGVTVIHLVINELDADTPSADMAEFVEISAGVANVPLNGYSLVLWNGANEMSYLAVDLTATTNPAGLLVVGNPMVTSGLTFPENTLQNGADAVGLYAAAASSFSTGSLLTTTHLIDAVVYGTADPDDTELLDGLFGAAGTPGRLQVDEAANAMSDMQSIQRCGAGRLRDDEFTVAAPSPNAANPVAACN
jgi:hypothetical protein